MAVGDSVVFDAANPGAVVAMNVLGNDSGTFGTYPVVIAIPPSKGSVTVSGTGIVTYTANNGASGTDYFTYYLRDASWPHVCSGHRVDDDPPAGLRRRLHDRPGQGGDVQPQGQRHRDLRDLRNHLRHHHQCPPSHGSVSLGTCGTITYTPSGSYTGTDSFRYVITDTSALESNEVTATVTVYPPPTAVNDSATTNCDTTAVTIPVQSNDTMPAGSATTSIVSGPANGHRDCQRHQRRSSLLPSNFSGTTSFTYKLTDVYGNTSNTATVTVR